MFTVIDTKTGREPNLEQIALEEDWAKGLIYCDMEGFFLSEDGNLILADECGNWVYPPQERFKTVQNAWVSVEDRLPSESGYYLGVEDGEVWVFHYTINGNDAYWETDETYRCEVNYWQPLPALPEE